MQAEQRHAPNATLNMTGIYHLLVLYIVWSSTYLAIRFAVRTGSGFAPFIMTSSRLFIAGLILFAIACFSHHRIRLTKTEFIRITIAALLLWVFAHSLVVWAEQKANSGLAALIVSTTPIWTAFLNSLFSKKAPSLMLVGSLTFGFCGLVVLMYPALSTGNQTELLHIIAIAVASLAWSGGSFYQSHYPVQLSATVVAAYQNLIAALAFFVLSLVAAEPIPHPAPEALLAWAYLIVFGSVLAYTSFTQALRLLPINIVMTYAYVNPILALFLGWLFLHETISGATLLGAAMVILAVFGVFQSRNKECTAS